MKTDQNWSHPHSLVMAEAKRNLPQSNAYETRYFISSLPPGAKLLLHPNRSRWSIKSSFH
jgi:hypothetical protein